MKKSRRAKKGKIKISRVLIVLIIILAILFFINSNKNQEEVAESSQNIDNIAPIITLADGEKTIIAKRRKICA